MFRVKFHNFPVGHQITTEVPSTGGRRIGGNSVCDSRYQVDYLVVIFPRRVEYPRLSPNIMIPIAPPDNTKGFQNRVTVPIGFIPSISFHLGG